MGTKAVPARPSELIILAINNLEEKEGSSSTDIVQFISEEFQMKPEEVTPRVQEALKRAITYGIISQKDGKYKIQDIPQQKQSRDGSVQEMAKPEGTSSGRNKDSGQTEDPKGKKRAPAKRPVAKKRKLPPKSRKGSKKVCRRCQSRRM